MPRLGRTPFLRKQYRWSLDTERRKLTPKEAEQRRQAEARRRARGFV